MSSFSLRSSILSASKIAASGLGCGNPAFLKKVGDNLYVYEHESEYKPLEESGAIRQGFVEESNVNAVKMMTQLIETNRLVGMYQKAMDTQMNEMNRDAIEKLAKRA